MSSSKVQNDVKRLVTPKLYLNHPYIVKKNGMMIFIPINKGRHKSSILVPKSTQQQTFIFFQGI